MTGAPMTPMTSSGFRLVVLPDGGPVHDNRIGVPADGPERIALLTIETEPEPVRAAVRLIPLADVPAGVVAVGQRLAAASDLDETLVAPPWRLDPVPVVDLAAIHLETSNETGLEESARQLSQAHLDGELLWLPGDDTELWLTVDGVPHRVRSWDAGGAGSVIGRIAPSTRVDVYSPAVRNGVDIVILADVSGSMSCTDIEMAGAEPTVDTLAAQWSEPRRPQSVSRMAALRSVLSDLLRIRLQISGRTSRIALVTFDMGTSTVFPLEGGMTELDAGSPPHVVDEFQTAVALLTTRRGNGTDIGNALHEAAGILFRHGKPGNDRLVVLVSDGAHWTPRGEQGTGELVVAREEPVSLMEHLQRETGVRLHAIGISTPELYRRWSLRSGMHHETMLPNHELLSRLVVVGGGDPATIGGHDVLSRYFSGLGSGLSRRVDVRARAERDGTARLPTSAVQLLIAAAPTRSTEDQGIDSGRRRQLAQNIAELSGLCMEQARRVLESPLLNALYIKDQVQARLANDRENLWKALRTVATACRPVAVAADTLPGSLARALADYEAVLDSFDDRRARQGDSLTAALDLAEDLVAGLRELLRELSDAQPARARAGRRTHAGHGPDDGADVTVGADVTTDDGDDDAVEAYDPLRPAAATAAAKQSTQFVFRT